MEAEIVFVLGSRLAGPGPRTTMDVARRSPGSPRRWRSSTRGSRTGASSSPTPSPTWRPTARSRSQSRLALDGLNPRLIGMTITRNGELMDTGAGAAALGDPVAVVAWLANVPGQEGVALEPGDLVMTGRCTPRCRWRPGMLPRRVRPARPVTMGREVKADRHVDPDDVLESWPTADQGHRADRDQPHRRPPGAGPRAAYRVQRSCDRSAGALVGWKLGVTSGQAAPGQHQRTDLGFLRAEALDLGEPLRPGD